MLIFASAIVFFACLFSYCFGVGIISYMEPVYIAEIAPPNLRGSLGAVNQLSLTIGIMLAYLFEIFIEWRILAILGILPCNNLIPGLFFIPQLCGWQKWV